MFANFGMTEILIILFVIILLFGGKKIPELAKSLGKGIRQFKNEIKEVKEDINIKEDVNKIIE